MMTHRPGSSAPRTVSVHTATPAQLEQRLRARGTESEAAIARRLAGAARELEHLGEYQYQVINEDRAAAIAELRAIVEREVERSKHAG